MALGKGSRDDNVTRREDEKEPSKIHWIEDVHCASCEIMNEERE